MSDRRNAIVTGAASGLGQAIALRLAREGWRIALCDIDTSGAEETLTLVRRAGSDGFVHRLDIAELDEWNSLAELLETEFDHLDLLVNNAGIGGSGEVGQFSIYQWRRVLDIDLLGAIYGCHTFVERLKRCPRGGHIINTASFAAMASAPAMAAYNVAKAGVLALSETLYAELRQHGVGVTAICPMFFRTKLLDGWSCGGQAERLAAEFYTENAGFTADDVADAAVRAMNRKRLYVVIGAKARWYWRLKRLAPQWFLNLMASRYTGWLKRAGTSRPPVPRPASAVRPERVAKQ